MKLVVKVIKSKQEYKFDVQPTDTPASIMEELKVREKQPDAIVRLVYSSRILKADYTFYAQFVSDNAVLYAAFSVPKPVNAADASLPAVLDYQPPTNAAQNYSFRRTGDSDTSSSTFSGAGAGLNDIRGVMNNPFLRSLLQYPTFLKSMMENPMMQQLKERNPLLGEMLEDPETLYQMQEVMTDPVKMDELLRYQDAMMNTISNNPEALRMYQKLRYDMEEIQHNAQQHPEMYYDFAANPEEASRNAYAREEIQAQRQYPVSRQEYYPKTYVATLNGWFGQYPPTAANNANNAFGGFGGLPAAQASDYSMQMDSLAQQMNMSKEQLEYMMNDPTYNYMVDSLLNDPEQFNLMFSNPMMKQQLVQAIPQAAYLLEYPELFRQMVIATRAQQKKQAAMGAAPRAQQAQQAPAFYMPTYQQKEQAIAQLRERYGYQLDFIKSLGCEFSDEQILQALEFCNGNCETAMNYLLDNY